MSDEIFNTIRVEAKERHDHYVERSVEKILLAIKNALSDDPTIKYYKHYTHIHENPSKSSIRKIAELLSSIDGLSARVTFFGNIKVNFYNAEDI